MHLEMKGWQGAGTGGGGRRQAEPQAGSNTTNENPLGGTVPAVLRQGHLQSPARAGAQGDSTAQRGRMWLSEGRLTMIDGAVLCSQ